VFGISAPGGRRFFFLNMLKIAPPTFSFQAMSFALKRLGFPSSRVYVMKILVQNFGANFFARGAVSLSSLLRGIFWLSLFFLGFWCFFTITPVHSSVRVTRFSGL